jgi:hypothetical protein
MSRPNTPTYKTLNWPAYNKALKRRGSLTIWFDPAMTWEAAPTGKRGRQPDYSDAAIQTCLTMKVLFGMALRQTTGFVESLLRLIGLDWAVPDFSTLSRRQKTLKVNIVDFHPEVTRVFHRELARLKIMFCGLCWGQDMRDLPFRFGYC